MSKTDIRLELLRPLDELLRACLMRAYSIYGFLALVPEENGRFLKVTYDATRLTDEEVASELRRLGIPVAMPRPGAGPQPA